jgi:hypothetical protein
LPWPLALEGGKQFIQAVLLNVGCFDFMTDRDPLPTSWLQLINHVYESACEALIAMLPAYKVHGFLVQHPDLETIIVEYFGYTTPQCLISMFLPQGQDHRHQWLRYCPGPDDETKIWKSSYLRQSRWIVVNSANRYLPWGIRLAQTEEEAIEAAAYCALNQIETYIVDLDGVHAGTPMNPSGLDTPVPAETMVVHEGQDAASADRPLPSVEVEEI